MASNARAQELYSTYQAELDRKGKWRSEYNSLFVILIDAIVKYEKVSILLGAEGIQEVMTSHKTGSQYTNPLVNVWLAYANTVHRYGTAFGLTPLGDAKIKGGIFGVGDITKMMDGPPEL